MEHSGEESIDFLMIHGLGKTQIFNSTYCTIMFPSDITIYMFQLYERPNYKFYLRILWLFDFETYYSTLLCTCQACVWCNLFFYSWLFETYYLTLLCTCQECVWCNLFFLLFDFWDLLFNPFVYLSSVCFCNFFLLFDFWDLLFNPFVYLSSVLFCNFFLLFDFWDLLTILTLLCTCQVCVWCNLFFYSLTFETFYLTLLCTCQVCVWCNV